MNQDNLEGDLNMSKFVKGVRVQVKETVLNPHYNWGDIKRDEIGVVRFIDADGDVVVDFPSQIGWYARPNELRYAGKRTRVYAVVKGDNVLKTTSTRDEARVIKAAAGGKKAGVTIQEMVPLQEVR